MEDYEYTDSEFPELELGEEFTTNLGETFRVVGFEANGCPICEPVKKRR